MRLASRPRRPRRSSHLRLEPLEARRVPANLTWPGGTAPPFVDPGTGPAAVSQAIVDGLYRPGAPPPSVTAATPADDATLDRPPTVITVRFSDPVNLVPLVDQNFANTGEDASQAVFLTGDADGSVYFPHLTSYDLATNTATFLLFDRLPAGGYDLHLSGAKGLADFAGQPLQGNDPSGDFVAWFEVTGPADDTGNRTGWTANGAGGVQDIGPLYPHELDNGFTITRQPVPAAGPTPALADTYQIQFLEEDYAYRFSLEPSATGSLPQDLRCTLWDASGHLVASTTGPGEFTAPVPPGTYTLKLDGWTGAGASQVGYRLRIVPASGMEAPIPWPLPSVPPPGARLALATGPVSPVAGLVPPVRESAGAAHPPAPPPEQPGWSGATSRDWGTVPGDVLAALGSGPVGGPAQPETTAALAGAERFFADSQEWLLQDGVMPVALLTQAPAATPGDGANWQVPLGMSEAGHTVGTLAAEGSRASTLWSEPVVQAPAGQGATAASTDADGEQGRPTSGDARPAANKAPRTGPARTAGGPARPDWLWANAIPALGALAWLARRGRDRVRQGPSHPPAPPGAGGQHP